VTTTDLGTVERTDGGNSRDATAKRMKLFSPGSI